MFRTLLNRVRSDVVGTDAKMTRRNLLSLGNVVKGFRAAEFECIAHQELRPQLAF